MKPLTPQQFHDALSKGLGRAMLQVKEHGIDGLEEVLLAACLKNLVLDPQSEGTRGGWLFEILELTRSLDDYRRPILDALRTVSPDSMGNWTACQLMVLAGCFAERGCVESRRAIYEVFDRQEFGDPSVGGHTIINLDGLDGLGHVAEVVGADLPVRDVSGWSEYLVIGCEEDSGKEATEAFLAERAGSSQAVTAFVDHVASKRKPISCQPEPNLPTLDEFVEAMRGEDYFPMFRFARLQDDATLAEAFRCVLAEPDPRVQARGLRAFARRPMPWLDEKVIAMAKGEDDELASAALRALGAISDERVRELGVAMLRDHPEWISRGAARLLAKNYRPGDHRYVEAALPAGGDADQVHDVVMDIKSIPVEHKSPEIKDLLLWAYEQSPCSFCRECVVRDLIDLDMMPQELLVECLWDCQDETRDLVRPALGQHFVRDSR
jgi:hypothetical protein